MSSINSTDSECSNPQQPPRKLGNERKTPEDGV
jgi:hypothetical protein